MGLSGSGARRIWKKLYFMWSLLLRGSSEKPEQTFTCAIILLLLPFFNHLLSFKNRFYWISSIYEKTQQGAPGIIMKRIPWHIRTSLYTHLFQPRQTQAPWAHSASPWISINHPALPSCWRPSPNQRDCIVWESVRSYLHPFVKRKLYCLFCLEVWNL